MCVNSWDDEYVLSDQQANFGGFWNQPCYVYVLLGTYIQHKHNYHQNLCWNMVCLMSEHNGISTYPIRKQRRHKRSSAPIKILLQHPWILFKLPVSYSWYAWPDDDHPTRGFVVLPWESGFQNFFYMYPFWIILSYNWHQPNFHKTKLSKYLAPFFKHLSIQQSFLISQSLQL